MSLTKYHPQSGLYWVIPGKGLSSLFKSCIGVMEYWPNNSMPRIAYQVMVHFGRIRPTRKEMKKQAPPTMIMDAPEVRLNS